jgi:hypothetical protein
MAATDVMSLHNKPKGQLAQRDVGARGDERSGALTVAT